MRMLVSALCFLLCVPALAQQPELTIFHIRVGQGDSTLILGPAVDGERVSVLIDAGNIPPGGYDGGRIVRTVLWKQGVEQLDYFIATHYDADHIGGIVTGEEHLHGESFVLGRIGWTRHSRRCGPTRRNWALETIWSLRTSSTAATRARRRARRIRST